VTHHSRGEGFLRFLSHTPDRFVVPLFHRFPPVSRNGGSLCLFILTRCSPGRSSPSCNCGSAPVCLPLVPSASLFPQRPLLFPFPLETAVFSATIPFLDPYCCMRFTKIPASSFEARICFPPPFRWLTFFFFLFPHQSLSRSDPLSLFFFSREDPNPFFCPLSTFFFFFLEQREVHF